MSGRVLVIVSGKGGVGKTTLTAHIGAALALRGRKVVAVDADIGLRNLDIAMGLEHRIAHDLVDVVKGRCTVDDATIRDPSIPGLSLIPAPQVREASPIERQEMRGLCLMLREEHDYVLIDSPAGIDEGFRNAVAPADQAIVVATPTEAAVRNADRVIGLIEALGMEQPWLIVNRARPRSRRRRDPLNAQDVVKILSVSLLGIVPEDDQGMLWGGERALANGRPRTPLAPLFHSIAARIDGDKIPIGEPWSDDGLLSRLIKLTSLAADRLISSTRHRTHES